VVNQGRKGAPASKHTIHVHEIKTQVQGPLQESAIGLGGDHYSSRSLVKLARPTTASVVLSQAIYFGYLCLKLRSAGGLSALFGVARRDFC
jgi:hypothetical protein